MKPLYDGYSYKDLMMERQIHTDVANTARAALRNPRLTYEDSLVLKRNIETARLTLSAIDDLVLVRFPENVA